MTNDTLIIPEGITEIGASQYMLHKEIKKVVLPSTLRHIKEHAFEGCVNLEEVEFSEGLSTIGYSAFKDCKKLKTIALPDSLITIYGYAFKNCKSLKEAILPKDMDWVGPNAFVGCKNLEKVICLNERTHFLMSLGKEYKRNKCKFTIIDAF